MANRKDMEMMAASMYQQMLKNEEDSIIGTIMDTMATENIQLKQTIQEIKLKNLKNETINKGRTKPVDANSIRSGKRKGGTI